MSRNTNRTTSSSETTIKDIAIAKFTRDECLIIESFLAQYKLVVSNRNQASLVPVLNPKVQPILKLNRATFGKLKYKIEHIINPKNI